MKIKHNQMIQILKKHGFSPRDNTDALNGKLVKNTSFFDYFGIKQYYIYCDVMEWLGY